MLHRLVYISSNLIPSTTRAAFRAEVEQILVTSRRNNIMADITGALMFSSGFFGQVLEGPRPAVEATFERIQQDFRHADVSLLEFRSVAARTFEDWAMAYVGQDEEVKSAWPRQVDLARLDAETLLARLHVLVRREISQAT